MMKRIAFILITLCLVNVQTFAETLNTNQNKVISQTKELDGLKNFQVDQNNMISAGLPSKAHFESLKTMGLSHVIDLIPGDRSAEATLLKSMEIPYNNVAVDWRNPTLQNFIDYVAYMKVARKSEGIVLTHCKLNWRGAVFTYLFRVTQLKHDESEAKAHMLETWKPNRRWQQFIDEVKLHYI